MWLCVALVFVASAVAFIGGTAFGKQLEARAVTDALRVYATMSNDAWLAITKMGARVEALRKYIPKP